MATLQAIFALSDKAPTTGTINTVTSSAEIAVGAGSLNAFVCDQDAHIRVGDTGLAAADNTYFRIPANVIFALEMNRNHGFIRIFNPSGSTARYHIVQMYRS